MAPAADRAELAPIVAAEVHAQFACAAGPLGVTGLALINAARLSFDLLLRGRVAPASAAIVDGLRVETDEACGLLPRPLPPPPADPAPQPRI